MKQMRIEETNDDNIIRIRIKHKQFKLYLDIMCTAQARTVIVLKWIKHMIHMMQTIMTSHVISMLRRSHRFAIESYL